MRRFEVLVVFTACVAILSFAGSPAAAQASKRPITLDDMIRLKSVGDPQVSPDGKWVAYSVGTVDAEKERRDSDLWMTSWDGSQKIRLTAAADSSENQPRWSPDNRYLAFVASRERLPT